MKISKITSAIAFLACNISIGQNLVVNGDFENGDSDFTTEYVADCYYSPLASEIGSPWQEGIPNDGQYCVTEPHDWSSQFLGWTPVSSDSLLGAQGKMLHVNGNTTSGAKIWCQTINNIQQNQNYKFSTSITTIYAAGNQSELQFSINGTTLNEPIVAPANSSSWNTFFDLWNSENNTSAEICIVNNNTNSNGNDFVLDNIQFEPIKVVMPNVFNPNGNGINDGFTPINFNGIDNYTITIYDRWGLKMFTTTYSEMNIPVWDGKTENGSECASGVYFWVMDFEFLEGSEKIQKKENGFVHLVR